MVFQNLEPDMLQRIIVAQLNTFAFLYKLGVQIESAFKKGIIHRTSEPARRPFTRNTNASNSSIPRPVDVNPVILKWPIPFAATTSQPTGPNQN